MQSLLEGFGYAVLALAEAGAHDSDATVLENGLDILEVEVHDTTHGDNLSYALGCDGESIVGFGKAIADGELRIDLAQTLVVDYEQGIYVLGHLGNAFQSLSDFHVALEEEGDSDDTDGQDLHLTGTLGHNRSSASACAAAHAGSDENHSGAVVEEFLDLINTVQSSLTATLRAVSGSEALAELEFVGHGRVAQRLLVCVTKYVCDIVDALVVHVCHGVAAAATNSNHLDDAGVAGLHYELDATSLCVILFCHNFIYLERL